MRQKQTLSEEWAGLVAHWYAGLFSPKNNKGQTGGLLTQLIFGIGGFVIGLIVVFVIVSTIEGAGLLTAGSAEDNAVGNVTANFSQGVQNDLAPKIKTAVLVGGIVLILSILAILVMVWKRMGFGQGGGSL